MYVYQLRVPLEEEGKGGWLLEKLVARATRPAARAYGVVSWGNGSFGFLSGGVCYDSISDSLSSQNDIWALSLGVLQCVAVYCSVCCSVLHPISDSLLSQRHLGPLVGCVAVCCSMLQCVLQRVAPHFQLSFVVKRHLGPLVRCVAVYCSMLQCVLQCVLQYVAVCCSDI